MAVLLLAAGLRGTVVDPTRPPGRLATLAARPRPPGLTVRIAAGIGLGVLVGVVTRWPVAAVGLGGLVACWPALMGGSKAEQAEIVRLAAVVGWCEMLRDTTSGHAGLEQAIPATAAGAAPPIRPALARLCAQLRAQVPLEQGLAALAGQLDHGADLIIAALQMNVTSRGDGLVGVLTNLAVAGREELDLRRTITASRAGDRRAVQRADLGGRDVDDAAQTAAALAALTRRQDRRTDMAAIRSRYQPAPQPRPPARGR